MKKFLIFLVLCIGINTPQISIAEHPSSVYYPRPTTYDVKSIKWVISADDLLNLKSDVGTIIWDTFRISVVHFRETFGKIDTVFCGIRGTFGDDVWDYGSCGIKNKQLKKQYEDIRFIYSNYGDKKTLTHNLLLDVPGLIVNLFEI